MTHGGSKLITAMVVTQCIAGGTNQFLDTSWPSRLPLTIPDNKSYLHHYTAPVAQSNMMPCKSQCCIPLPQATFRTSALCQNGCGDGIDLIWTQSTAQVSRLLRPTQGKSSGGPDSITQVKASVKNWTRAVTTSRICIRATHTFRYVHRCTVTISY